MVKETARQEEFLLTTSIHFEHHYYKTSAVSYTHLTLPTIYSV